MHRVTILCSSNELLEHLKWAESNNVSLKWMGLSLAEAIETVGIEAEMEIEPSLKMPNHFDLDDPEHIILYMMKGFKVEADSIRHRLPSAGLSIYERLIEVKEGEISNRAPRYQSWECWLDGDQRALRNAKGPEDVQALYFGPAGLIRREIALLQKLQSAGYSWLGNGLDANRVIDRWGSVEVGIEALQELLK